jgi:hypothetical protein
VKVFCLAADRLVFKVLRRCSRSTARRPIADDVDVLPAVQSDERADCQLLQPHRRRRSCDANRGCRRRGASRIGCSRSSGGRRAARLLADAAAASNSTLSRRPAAVSGRRCVRTAWESAVPDSSAAVALSCGASPPSRDAEGVAIIQVMPMHTPYCTRTNRSPARSASSVLVPFRERVERPPTERVA